MKNDFWVKNDIGEIQQGIQSKILSHGLIGNYEIVRKIGEGSFSSVFLAVHVMTRHEVVLKSAEKLQLNLASEIANMSLLNHPHIVRLYEYIIMPDRVWLVLEYCGGRELFNHLVMSKIIKPLQACRLFAQLTGAVAYAHQLHCAHRDLKLENVLLDEDGNIKLGDFGFTRTYVPRTMLETVCGTESYMAPELLQHQKYNPEAADVWSLGVILYAMIYGKLPFDEDNTAETVKRIVEEDPPFPPVEKGEHLVDVARQLLRKQPNARPRAIDILELLKEPGRHQKQLLAKIAKHPESSYIFSSREERNVLKGMKALTIDLRTVASSVVHHKCDPLHGLWYTALDRQRGLNKHSSSDSRGCAVSALQRKKSRASMKSQNSQKKARSTSSARNCLAGDVAKESGNEDAYFRSEANAEERRTASTDTGQRHSIVFEPPSTQYSLVLRSPTPVNKSTSSLELSELDISPKEPLEQHVSTTLLQIFTASTSLANSNPSQPSKDLPELSARLQAEVLQKQQEQHELRLSSQSSATSGVKLRSSLQSRMNEFIERRSSGRSRRAIEKFVAAISFKKHISKDNLMNYYTPAIEDSTCLPVQPSQKSIPRLASIAEPAITDGPSTGASRSGIQYQSPKTNPRSSVYRRMNSLVLDTGKLSPPSSRRHSSLSLASSNSFSIGDWNKGLESQGDLLNGIGAELQNFSNSQTAQAFQSSPLTFSPTYGVTSTSLFSSVSRQMSTYSQISQISQLSQSSIEPSQLMGDYSESLKSTSSKFQTISLSSISRWNSSRNKWKAGPLQNSASVTPPGTPVVGRSRVARLNTVKGIIPSKIEEGEDEAEW